MNTIQYKLRFFIFLTSMRHFHTCTIVYDRRNETIFTQWLCVSLVKNDEMINWIRPWLCYPEFMRKTMNCVLNIGKNMCFCTWECSNNLMCIKTHNNYIIKNCVSKFEKNLVNFWLDVTIVQYCNRIVACTTLLLSNSFCVSWKWLLRDG